MISEINFIFIFQDSEWCWCVNTNTGDHIPGTSIQNSRPNCEAPQKSQIHRKSFQLEWKKCPAEEKEKFKTELMNYLTYLYKTKSSVLYEKRFSSSEEEVAKWHFNKMDRNSDGVRYHS